MYTIRITYLKLGRNINFLDHYKSRLTAPEDHDDHDEGDGTFDAGQIMIMSLLMMITSPF